MILFPLPLTRSHGKRLQREYPVRHMRKRASFSAPAPVKRGEKRESSQRERNAHKDTRKRQPQMQGKDWRTLLQQDCALGRLQRRPPSHAHHVYAIVDDQSNASLIAPQVADKLNASGPESKYYLSTCGGECKVRYGHRVTGLIVKSVCGRTARLPTLIECDGVPGDKEEIPTPDIAMQYTFKISLKRFPLWTTRQRCSFSSVEMHPNS